MSGTELAALDEITSGDRSIPDAVRLHGGEKDVTCTKGLAHVSFEYRALERIAQTTNQGVWDFQADTFGFR